MYTAIKTTGVLTLILAISLLIGCDRHHDDHDGHDRAAHHAADSAIEQTMCPVMDAPINKAYAVEYEGKTVYFCCPGCDSTFLEEPEKYLHKLPQFQE